MPARQREGVPQPDPLPSPRHSMIRRFWRVFRLLALLSIVIAAMAVVLVARGDPTLHIHMLIATALGVGLTVLLGTALMTLAFLSSSSGHDEQARGHTKENDDL
jgi:NAD/NADP transhydrogenase beta subunit